MAEERPSSTGADGQAAGSASMPSMPFAFIFYNVTPHPSTDAYARERFDEKDMLLLQQYVAGRFMMLQGNVAGSDFPLDAAETDATAQAAQAAQAVLRGYLH